MDSSPLSPKPKHRAVTRPVLLITSIILGCFCACSDNNPTGLGKPTKSTDIKAQVLKWYEGRTAAISLTYDTHFRETPMVDQVVDEVIRRNLRMDFEVTTATYDHPPKQDMLPKMREAIPSGIHFFGHGHKHDLHDKFTFDYSYNSFKICFDLMSQWGLNPKAYAYPGSSGYKSTTQLANSLAGFICSRGAALDPDSLYICSGQEREPVNWQYLPSAVMGQEYPEYFNTHAEIEPIMRNALDKTAWVILMYHSIGVPEGYSCYPMEDFFRDAEFISTNDFWCANMDDAACYIRERSTFRLDTIALGEENSAFVYEMFFYDGLDNAMYDHPLTVDLTFDCPLPVTSMEVDPPILGRTRFDVKDNTLRINVLPDEKRYRATLRAD